MFGSGSDGPNTLGIAPVLDGFTRSLIVGIVLTVLTGLVTFFSSLPEGHTPLMALLIFIISIFYGAAVAAKKAGGKGLYMGLSVSVLFLVATLLFSGIFMAGSFAVAGLVKKLLLGLAAGAIGGMFGLAFS